MSDKNVGYAAYPSGAKFDGTHQYSAASNILRTGLVPLTLDKTKWPASGQNMSVKEFWFKCDQIVTISQNHAGTQGLITFAANTWWVLPFAGNIVNDSFEIKCANNTNTFEYFFVVA